MDFQLLIVRGRSGSQALKLADGVTTIGRHDDCQIRIKSSQVSRRHCELFEKKGLLLVKDLGSSNGTFVNGKKIETQQVLEPGDEMTIGQVKLKVSKIGEPVPQKPAGPPSPGDTAVVEAIAVSAGTDDEFEIDFGPDDTADAKNGPDTVQLAEVAPAKKPEAAKAEAAKAEPAKPGPKSAEPDTADEAIADFLLDLKVDDE